MVKRKVYSIESTEFLGLGYKNAPRGYERTVSTPARHKPKRRHVKKSEFLGVRKEERFFKDKESAQAYVKRKLGIKDEMKFWKLE